MHTKAEGPPHQIALPCTVHAAAQHDARLYGVVVGTETQPTMMAQSTIIHNTSPRPIRAPPSPLIHCCSAASAIERLSSSNQAPQKLQLSRSRSRVASLASSTTTSPIAPSSLVWDSLVQRLCPIKTCGMSCREAHWQAAAGSLGVTKLFVSGDFITFSGT